MKLKPVCANCRSEDVALDAAARWDVDAQDWAVSGAFEDDAYCEDCGAVDIDFVEVNP